MNENMRIQMDICGKSTTFISVEEHNDLARELRRDVACAKDLLDAEKVERDRLARLLTAAEAKVGSFEFEKEKRKKAEEAEAQWRRELVDVRAKLVASGASLALANQNVAQWKATANRVTEEYGAATRQAKAEAESLRKKQAEVEETHRETMRLQKKAQKLINEFGPEMMELLQTNNAQLQSDLTDARTDCASMREERDARRPSESAPYWKEKCEAAYAAADDLRKTVSVLEREKKGALSRLEEVEETAKEWKERCTLSQADARTWHERYEASDEAFTKVCRDIANVVPNVSYSGIDE